MRYLLLLFFSVRVVGQPVRLAVKNTAITVDVAGGGRVVGFTVDGQEILGSVRINSRFYGSSLWLSPEGKWKGMGGLDAGAYKDVSIGDGVLRLRSAVDSVRGFVFGKEFRLSQGDTSVMIHYTITNTAGVAQDVAPWEVTRVPTGGLAFFPAGEVAALAKSDLTVREMNGCVWYPYDTIPRVRQKIFQHGAEGWTAYVKDGVLFVKRYPVIALSQAAPGEENVEMYANPEKTYIELENQGAYQSLAPGASLSYNVTWFARRLPADMLVAVGNERLVTFVRNLLNH